MNCWDLLGIEPTGDQDRIRQAYERQLKFASGDEAQALERAYREATGGAEPQSTANAPDGVPSSSPTDNDSGQLRYEDADSRALTSEEAQVTREVIIQIRALMNDNYRQQDVAIWKAILCEPPADRVDIRREIGRQLEPQVRPLAENGALPAPVARFLGDWFEWFSLKDVVEESDPRTYPESDMLSGRGMGEGESDSADQPPQMVNFWPAVIGWIVGLAILATIFGGMGGG